MAPRSRREGYAADVTGRPLSDVLPAAASHSHQEDNLLSDHLRNTAIAAEKAERHWFGIDLSPKAKELVELRLQKDLGYFGSAEYTTHRTDIPIRTDQGRIPPYRTQKHTLFGRQEGVCNGCKTAFPFRNFTIDHVVPQSKGASDHIDNLQLLCGACNSAKGASSQAELIATLTQQGVIG